MLPSTGRWAIHINTISPRTASGAAAEFTNPMGALELPCGRVLLSDRHRIRVLSADLQGLFEVAGGPTRFHHDGPATIAKFCWPHAFALLPDQRVLVTDMGNHRIRMLSADLQHVSTVAGGAKLGCNDGPAEDALFSNPFAMAVLPDGRVLVTDTYNHRIRMLSADLQHVSTVAGGGEGGAGPEDCAALDLAMSYPCGLTTLPDGRVLVADRNNHRIRVLSADLQTASTVAGTGEQGHRDGAAAQAWLDCPTGFAVLPDGRVLVTELGNHALRVLSADLQGLSTLAGDGEMESRDGSAAYARFHEPEAAVTLSGGRVLVPDGDGRCIRLLTGFPLVPPRAHMAAFRIHRFWRDACFDPAFAHARRRLHRICTGSSGAAAAESESSTFE